jgi:hypothetical protein
VNVVPLSSGRTLSEGAAAAAPAPALVPLTPRPAVVGHVDSYRGPGVFWHLRMRPGDTIDVPRSDGTVAHFGVDAVETVDKDAFPPSASTLRRRPLPCG